MSIPATGSPRPTPWTEDRPAGTVLPEAEGRTLARLLEAASPHRRSIRWAAACSVLNKIFDLAPPLLIGAAVDVVVQRENSWIAGMGIENLRHQLYALAAVTVLIWVLESIFEYAHKVLWRNLAQKVQHDLRIRAYAHVQGLEAAWFEDRSSGGLLAVLNDDVNQLERFLDVGVNELLQVTTTVIVIGAIFFGISPGVAGLAFLPVPLVLWGSVAFQKRIAPRYAGVRDRVGALSSQLSNNLSGIATIKGFAAEKHEVERVERESRAYQSSNEHAIRLSSAFSPLIRMVILVGFTSTLVFGGLQTLDGVLPVGSFSVLVFMTQRLLWPLTRLGETFDLYQRAMASTRRILGLLEVKPAIRDGDLDAPPEPVRGHVRFEDVQFAYATGPEILHGIDLDLPAGGSLAVVGATGAGKSTIVKLLLRFYDATGGRITLDGHDVRTWRLADLRRSIGLVSQDVFLFHGSVRENIAYGRRDATDAEIEAAARAAEAHGFIEDLPEGYDTVVGERGQKLSGGQRQRISIARAVLCDPPILVLDEATSSVDNETEAAIQRSLARIARGRTTLVIAHRLSTIRQADHIVVLEGGKIREQGRHDALIDEDGLYRALWNVQTGAAIEV